MANQSLPVDRFAQRIKGCVHSNTVTLIIGQTGCGKSSRVPQLLQQELGGAVVCTQPRRLAVVSIASHVAELTGYELGQEVGFRIGQKSVASRVTRMMFTTSGLLLEELRANGAAALKPYKCLIIDELHERSVESDLLLACLHAMLAAGELPTVKLVLMSATANVERYQSYFKLPGDHVALIRLDLQRLTTAIGDWLETVKVMYLDQVVSKLLADHRNNTQHNSLLQQHKAGSMTPLLQVGHGMSLLVRDLILHLHTTEPDPDAVILVFLPTYRALLLQHNLLLEKPSKTSGAAAGGEESSGSAGVGLDVFALHSSVDIDEALEAIQGPRLAGRRRVVLATNCAESSITLPHVKHVIDSCTTNQVYWDAAACREYARVTWASQSAAQQRAGRTGRTCPGTCYRLMTRLAFNALHKYESSALTLRSLRREVLCLLSSSSKVMAEPVGLLGQALDPPEADRVDAALDYLTQVGAAQVNPKGRIEPTQTGNFLAALPISLEAALLLVQGGLQGLTQEAAVLAALTNTTPFPILQPFGADVVRHVKQYSSSSSSRRGAGTAAVNSSSSVSRFDVQGSSISSNYAVDLAVEISDLFCTSASNKQDGIKRNSSSSFNANFTSNFGSSSSSSVTAGGVLPSTDDSPGGGGTPRSELLLANMAAFYAWQQQWWDPQRLQALTADDSQQQPPFKQSEAEAEWCRQHFLLPGSLRAVQELLGVIVAVLHRFRPSFVAHATGPPPYFLNKVAHRCHLEEGKVGCVCRCELLDSTTLLQADVCRQLRALLHEVSSGGTAEADARLLQVRLDNIQQQQQHEPGNTSSSSSSSRQSLTAAEEAAGSVCRYFLAGTCTRGSCCPFRHSRPVCKFYLSRTGCSYGSNCRFLHGSSSSGSSGSSSNPSGGEYCATQQQQQQSQPADTVLSFEWVGDTSSSSSSKKGSRVSCSKTTNTTAAAGPEAYITELLDHPVSSSSTTGSGIVLLGDGDLSFAAALVSARRAAGLSCHDNITATVLEADLAQLAELYPHSRVATRVADLVTAGVSVQYGVDATRLPLVSSEGSTIRWQDVGHLVWNFPLATAAEATGVPLPPSVLLGECDASNKQLMSRFFKTAARLLLGLNPQMKVHLALCNDQYARWAVDAISRTCFMFLQSSKPLNLSTWPGYSPKRGQLEGTFPAERLVVCTFGLHLPQACSVATIRQQVLQLQLLQQCLQERGLRGASALCKGLGEEQQQQQVVVGKAGLLGWQRAGGAAEGVCDDAEEGLGDIGFSVYPGQAVMAGN